MLATLREFIRPLVVATMLTMLLGGAVASGIMEAIRPGMGVNFTVGVAGWFQAIPEIYYQTFMALGLGYIAAREVGKWKNSDSEVSDDDILDRP